MIRNILVLAMLIGSLQVPVFGSVRQSEARERQKKADKEKAAQLVKAREAGARAQMQVVQAEFMKKKRDQVRVAEIERNIEELKGGLSSLPEEITSRVAREAYMRRDELIRQQAELLAMYQHRGREMEELGREFDIIREQNNILLRENEELKARIVEQEDQLRAQRPETMTIDVLEGSRRRTPRGLWRSASAPVTPSERVRSRSSSASRRGTPVVVPENSSTGVFQLTAEPDRPQGN